MAPADLPLAYAAFALFLVLLVALAVALTGRRQARALRVDRDSARAEVQRVSFALSERESNLAESREVVRTAEAELCAANERLRETHGDAERSKEGQIALREAVGKLETERDRLSEALEAARGEAGTLRQDLRGLRTEMAKDRATAEREIATLRELRAEISREFKELADATLRQHGEEFGKLNREKLDALLAPFRQHVTHFQEELRGVHKSAGEERIRLQEQIAHLTRRSEEVSQEAVNLTRALKGEKQRQGAWGEMILERILEDSGLEEGREYRRQAPMRADDGRLVRPDVVVKMPKGKSLIVDSKVSLVAYEAGVNAADDGERKARMREHVAALRSHIDALAAKDYHALDDGSVDYVLMFLPIEGALSEALRLDGDLTGYALRKGVGVMTPMTLMVTLRTVEHVWAVERREANAERIADRAGKLYDKVALFAAAMEDVGKHLRKAEESHGRAFDRLSRGRGNILGQVEELKRMGARTTKAIGAEFDDADAPPALPDKSRDAPETGGPAPEDAGDTAADAAREVLVQKSRA